MEKEKLTKKEVRDLYLELTDLLVFSSSKEDAKNRVEDVYNNEEIESPEDFKYEIAREWNENTGEEFKGTMFILNDWKVTVDDVVWNIKKILGDATDDIVFPKEDDIEKDAYYSHNVLLECAMALKEKGIIMVALDTDMDYSIHYLVKGDDFAKVYSIFKQLESYPLKPYKRKGDES